MVWIGSNHIQAAYVGNTSLSSIWHGSDLVWPDPIAGEPCAVGTRPEYISCLLEFAGVYPTIVANPYTGADWLIVLEYVIGRHLLRRIGGNVYQKNITIKDTDHGDIDIGVGVEFTATGPTGSISVSPGSQPASYSGATFWNAAAAPYLCDAVWQFGAPQSVTDPAQLSWGGINFNSAQLKFAPASAPAIPATEPDWAFFPGDIDKAQHDAWYASKTFHVSTGRYRGDNSNESFDPAFTTADCRWIFQVPYEIPRINDNGEIVAQLYNDYVHNDPSGAEKHTQFVPGVSSRTGWSSLRYLGTSPNRWRVHMKFKLDGEYSTNWAGLAWNLVFDALPITRGPDWVDDQNPVLGLYYYGSNFWRMRVAGGTSNTNYDYEEEFDIQGAEFGVNQEHDLAMEFELDGTGANSYTAMWLDGLLIAETTGANCIQNSYGDGRIWCKYGAYGTLTRGPNTTTRIRQLEIWRI